MLTITIDGEKRDIKHLLQNGDGNTKLRKNSKRGVKSYGLSLAPHKSAGIGNTCPFASRGCAAACLDHQGLASVFESIQRARRAKTIAYYENRFGFLAMLQRELTNKTRNAKGALIVARLNVFSDIAWERHEIIETNPTIEFYDYTKNPSRAGLLARNYWVTFSRSETNEDDCLHLLNNACNVAVVFADMSGNYVGNRAGLQRLPKTWNGFQVIDGDTTDLRFEDTRGRKRGRVVGLRLKAHSGQERFAAINSGFAVPC